MVEHPGVDAYIEQLPRWQQDVCRQLRAIVHEADPEVEETIKRAIQIYEADTINRAALLAMLRAVIARNRAGGWRRLKAHGDPCGRRR